jgi:hypothetical protein
LPEFGVDAGFLTVGMRKLSAFCLLSADWADFADDARKIALLPSAGCPATPQSCSDLEFPFLL